MEVAKKRLESEQAPFISFLQRHYEMIASLISGLFIGLGFLFSQYETILFVTAFVVGGYAKAKEGITDLLFNKKLSVEILMILAATGSAIIGFWAEGAILIFIFALSGALETYSKNKSVQELSSLMELQPNEATLLTASGEKIVPVTSLKVNDTIFVKPGERVPADGNISEGRSSVDEAAITGESVPITKQLGDEVFAGTVNINGTLTITVTKAQQDTLFQRIITLVQQAQDEKSPTQQFIERFEGTYVKIVLIVVFFMLFIPHYAFGWTWQETWYRAMVLLVVASPCALVASITPATLSSLATAAKKGILVKGGNFFESLASLNSIAFDKTGTLTKGKHEVTDLLSRANLSEEHLLQAAASIENHSTHPLAVAIVRYSETKNIELLPATQFADFAGKGVEAVVNGKKWRLGKRDFVASDTDTSFGENEASLFESEGKSVIFIGDEQGIAGLITVKDTIRDEANRAIKHLKENGIHTIMITGDGEGAAHAISKEAGLDHYLANTLPEDKLVEINKLKAKYDHVAMIGDGINDAPALATANIGIAMGGGSDIALETADVVLTKNNLMRIPEAINISKKMNRIVKQNIFFSIAVILVLIATNFMQIIDLPLGVIGHEGSTLLVILNGLRMLSD